MEPFKNIFSPGLVMILARHLARHVPGLDADMFCAPIVAKLAPLELKARAQLIADHLHAALPGDSANRAAVLRAILHPDRLDHADQPSDDRGLCGWAILPLTMVVGQHGVADFDRGMALMREMTMRFSAEFGIRHFLLADQARALAIMAGWLDDPNRHVRRLVSEGSRPRLPWAMRLPALMADPGPALPLLERLRDDPEPYVRRSVANHLNDIAKDHPRRVAALLADWARDGGKDRMALLRHAARGLIKAGDADALAVFGHGMARIAPAVPVLSTTRLQMGDTLAFDVALTSLSDAPQSLSVDYVLHYRKATGMLSPKVFKGARLMLNPGETRTLRRRHSFRDVTTRRHYPGDHALSLRINGQDSDRVVFMLLPPPLEGKTR